MKDIQILSRYPNRFPPHPGGYLAGRLAAILVTAVGRDPLEVVDALWKGAFKDSSQGGRRGQLLDSADPGQHRLWLSPSAPVLWNIGVEGQMMMGALFASWGAQYIPLMGCEHRPPCSTWY